MKSSRASACCFCLFFGVSLLFSAAQAQDKNTAIEELLKSLQSAVTENLKIQKDKKTDESNSRASAMAAYAPQSLTALRQSIERGDTDSTRETLRQLQSILPDPAIAELIVKLQAEIEKVNAARERTYVETIDTTIEKAVTLAFKAKEPKELDNPILELSRLSQRTGNYNSSQVSQRSSEKARSAVNFLCRWQDYLMQLKSGNIDAANSGLKSLSQDTSSYPFIPRSEILSRMKPGSDPDKTPASSLPDLEGKTLKDLKAIRGETDKLLEKQPNSQPLRQFSQNLENFERARQQQQSGLLGQAYNYCVNRDYNGSDALSGLKQELLLELLPSYLDLKDTYPTKQGEAATDYLQRISKEARTKGDWQTAWKSLETYRNVAFSNGQGPSWLSADVQGLSYFIVAQNQEKAGQYADAVRSYKRVIALTGQNLPIAETTERLNSIQKEHADDFAKGTEVISPYSAVRTPVPAVNTPVR